jgi:hypothetical protein
MRIGREKLRLAGSLNFVVCEKNSEVAGRQRNKAREDNVKGDENGCSPGHSK